MHGPINIRLPVLFKNYKHGCINSISHGYSTHAIHTHTTNIHWEVSRSRFHIHTFIFVCSTWRRPFKPKPVAENKRINCTVFTGYIVIVTIATGTNSLQIKRKIPFSYFPQSVSLLLHSQHKWPWQKHKLVLIIYEITLHFCPLTIPTHTLETSRPRRLVLLSTEHHYTLYFNLVMLHHEFGRWQCGRKGSWGCLRIWCWGEYLDLGGTR